MSLKNSAEDSLIDVFIIGNEFLDALSASFEHAPSRVASSWTTHTELAGAVKENMGPIRAILVTRRENNVRETVCADITDTDS